MKNYEKYASDRRYIVTIIITHREPNTLLFFFLFTPLSFSLSVLGWAINGVKSVEESKVMIIIIT